ncbi:MAG: M3 family metallopeptidase, partial [Candidatus Paceibacterota bacterium]
YSSTVLTYQNDDSTVQALVSAVTEGFPIVHSYSKLRAKLLNLKTLRYCDRNVQLGIIKKEFPFEESYKELQEVFGNFHPRYKDLLTHFVEQGQVDVFPKLGKRGGAFCSNGHGTPTVVMLNHDKSSRCHSTFAHEMGHAFHSEESKVQGPLYEAYTISVAEVASTFFEQLAFDHRLKESSKEEKIILLDSQINEAIATVFRQIAVFNYELELHTLVRSDGMQSYTKMASLMTKHLQAYLGDTYQITEDDGYCFVLWPHLRYVFYVYSYASGYIISRALFERYKKNPEYRESIMTFLSLGASMQPEDIFASIGIDIRSKEFYQEGLRAIERDIEELASLTV